MKHTKSLVLFAALAAGSMAACSGLGDDGAHFGGGGTSGGGGTTNATFSVTLQAKPLALPANATILSYSLTIGGLVLTPATGSAIASSGSATFDLTRLQSDSALLATFSAPAGNYTSMSLSISTASVTYCTVTAGVAGCNPGTVASTTVAGTNGVITFPNGGLVLTSGQETGASIDYDMGSTLTVLNQVPTLSFTNLNLTLITLGSAHLSSLTSTQLDYLEDITGAVSVSGNQVTITTHNGVKLITTADSNTFYSPNCNNAGIGDGTNTINCVQNNQLASINAALNQDGTLELLSYDPLAPVSTTSNDWIEGIVVFTPTNAGQLTIVANDAAVTSSGTLLPNPFPIGAPITVNFKNSSPITLNVDTQGLQVPADFTNFVGTFPATTLLAGQTVAFHVLSFTAGSPASIMTDNAIVRFTRIAGSASQGGVVNNFTYDSTTLPTFYSFSTPTELVELTSGTPPTTNSTNFDGITDSSGITTGNTYSVRALFFGQFDAFPFVAAKVRQNQ